MPSKLAKVMEDRLYPDVLPPNNIKISWPTIILLVIMGYFLISGSMKLKMMDEHDQARTQKWSKCLEDYVHNVCPVKHTKDKKGQECFQLLECIKCGQSVSLPEKSVFLVENTLKEAGTIAIALLLIYFLFKNLF